jgi:hypothetical protein
VQVFEFGQRIGRVQHDVYAFARPDIDSANHEEVFIIDLKFLQVGWFYLASVWVMAPVDNDYLSMVFPNLVAYILANCI